MKMHIEFDLPDEVLRKAATTATAALFAGPEYGRSGAVGYQAIEAAAKKEIAGIDWTAQIAEVVARLAPEIVYDVVGKELRAMVRAQAKAMVADGTLMEGKK